jgi:protoporphyrinogen oxidase
MARVLIIGAGIMGLAAAYQAVTDGHRVDLVEASPEPSGMAGHFDFDGDSIEHQPIWELGFAAKIPPVRTPADGLQIADTCFYYPEDRGIAESVRLGRSMARSISSPKEQMR